MPHPVSEMEMMHWSFLFSVRMVIVPSSEMDSAEFSRRFRNTCWIWFLSAIIGGRASQYCSEICMFLNSFCFTIREISCCSIWLILILSFLTLSRKREHLDCYWQALFPGNQTWVARTVIAHRDYKVAGEVRQICPTNGQGFSKVRERTGLHPVWHVSVVRINGMPEPIFEWRLWLILTADIS